MGDRDIKDNIGSIDINILIITMALVIAFVGEFYFKYYLNLKPCMICTVLNSLISLITVLVFFILTTKSGKAVGVSLVGIVILSFMGMLVSSLQYYGQYTGILTVGCDLINLCSESPIKIGKIIYSSTFTFLIFLIIGISSFQNLKDRRRTNGHR